MSEQMERRAYRDRMEESKDYQMEGVESTFQEFSSAGKNYADFHSEMEIVQQIDSDIELKPFDLDKLHEHNLKIFGDVFESLIGAVFMDS